MICDACCACAPWMKRSSWRFAVCLSLNSGVWSTAGVDVTAKFLAAWCRTYKLELFALCIKSDTAPIPTAMKPPNFCGLPRILAAVADVSPGAREAGKIHEVVSLYAPVKKIRRDLDLRDRLIRAGESRLILDYALPLLTSAVLSRTDV